MIVKIRKYGGSTVIILSPTIREILKLKVGDWVDVSKLKKLKKAVGKNEN